MTPPRSNTTARRTRRAATLFCLLAAAAAWGCGDAARRADLYRVQAGLWSALRAEQGERLSGARPDSAALLSVREKYLEAVESVPAAALEAPAGAPRSEAQVLLLRTVGKAEVQAAQLAMEAGRPDLALERCRALAQRAEGDTSVTRQADIVIAGALRRMGRHEESIDVLKGMLARYVPRADTTGVEDFLLTIPERVIELRRELGDETGVAEELIAAERYFSGLLVAGDLDPRLEAQVRTRLVRTHLERDNVPMALAELDSLESLVVGKPGLEAVIPDVRYTRAKLRSARERDHAETISTLERIAFDFPMSQAAAPALFDAGVLYERSNRFEEALAAYQRVIDRYPANRELCATATLRQAFIEDRLGRWPQSKALLESVWAKYPRSAASAQAPIGIADHYVRVGEPEGVETSLRRAVTVYDQMIATDPNHSGTARLRWNRFRCLARLGETEEIFAAAEQLAEAHTGSPFAAQALLEAAKIAEGKKLTARAVGYLARFVQDYPDAPQAGEARRRLEALSRQG